MNIEIPTLERLIEVAQLSDVVYSISRKVFDYFAIVFRAQNVLNVDHRLYIPSAPKEVGVCNSTEIYGKSDCFDQLICNDWKPDYSMIFKVILLIVLPQFGSIFDL